MKIITNKINIEPESEYNLDSVLFFDIETTGLSKENSQVYLIGCAYRNSREKVPDARSNSPDTGCQEEGEQSAWVIRQYLAESAMDERYVVEDFLKFAEGFKTLIHFNGERFDVPYIDYKAGLYDIDFKLSDMDNIDIYKNVKPLRTFLGMESMSQKAIEQFLGIARDDEMGGGELIPYFYEYEKTADVHLERLLLLHNFDDIQGMLKITVFSNYLGVLDGAFIIDDFRPADNNMTFDIRLEKNLPVPFEKAVPGLLFAGNDDFAQLVVNIYEGEAEYQIEDYKNYYYLTMENKVIHKDVAQFVDREYRRKAKKSECFVKKDSRFLPQHKNYFEPVFMKDNDRICTYFEIEELRSADPLRIKAYVLDLIRHM